MSERSKIVSERRTMANCIHPATKFNFIAISGPEWDMEIQCMDCNMLITPAQASVSQEAIRLDLERTKATLAQYMEQVRLGKPTFQEVIAELRWTSAVVRAGIEALPDNAHFTTFEMLAGRDTQPYKLHALEREAARLAAAELEAETHQQPTASGETCGEGGEPYQPPAPCKHEPYKLSRGALTADEWFIDRAFQCSYTQGGCGQVLGIRDTLTSVIDHSTEQRRSDGTIE